MDTEASTSPQAPGRHPLARAFAVLFAPGAVMEDVVRRPGWLAPFLMALLAAVAFQWIYISRADMAGATIAQMERNPLFQLGMSFAGDEVREKVLQETRKEIEGTPTLAFQLSAVANTLIALVLMLQVFTLIVALLAYLAGHSAVPLGKGFLNLGISVGFLLAMIACSIVVKFALKDSKTQQAVAGLVLVAVVMVPYLWFLIRLGRDAAYGPLLGVVGHAMMAFVPGNLLSLAIAFPRTGIITPLQDLAPTNLRSLLLGEEAQGPLASLLSSADLFWIWFWVLVIIGLRRATGFPAGKAASVALAPWVVWIVLKVLFSFLV